MPKSDLTEPPELPALPAALDRNHALVLIPRDEQWEVRMIYISPICLSPLFPSQQQAFDYGQTLIDQELNV